MLSRRLVPSAERQLAQEEPAANLKQQVMGRHDTPAASGAW